MWRLVRSIPAKWRAAIAVAIAVVLILGLYTVARLRSDSPVRYADAVEHFKYGSTGGEKLTGIPYAIWMILPSLFPE